MTSKGKKGGRGVQIRQNWTTKSKLSSVTPHLHGTLVLLLHALEFHFVSELERGLRGLLLGQRHNRVLHLLLERRDFFLLALQLVARRDHHLLRETKNERSCTLYQVREIKKIKQRTRVKGLCTH